MGGEGMREAVTSHERWVFECLSCLRMWAEEYDAQHLADGHGGEVVLYEHHGHRCPSPWADHTCPGCASPNIKAFPAPEAARRQGPSARPTSELELVFRLRRLHAY